tara:strand:- start:64 stop:399 length:336 start_codon:yes stop_codon:yes gene_type:complete
MANTYNWNINQMSAKIQEGELQNVIWLINYTYIGKDETVTPIIMSTVNGSIRVQYNEGDPFIPYADLTKNDVIGWLEASEDINIEGMKENIDKQIYDQKNPVDENLYPNWD